MTEKDKAIQDLLIKLDDLKKQLYAAKNLKLEYRLIEHGTWINCHCSVCGEEAIIAQNDTGGAWIMTPYCPFCGARLEYHGREDTDEQP